MSHQYETGNAKNVANFQKLIEQITLFTDYNPSISSLTLENLNTLYTTAHTSITELLTARNANKVAKHKRQQDYENLKPLCTKVINLLEILGLNKGDLDQAKSLNNSIQGYRKKKTTTDSNQEEEHKSISTSRQSYTQKAENFTKLIQLLTTIPSYNPNPEDLKLTSLTAYRDTLVSNTLTVDQTEAAQNVKLINRNNILYTEGTGLYTIAQNVKKYIKSIYGANSAEYSKIAKIKFTTP